MENVEIKNVGMANQKTIMPIIGEVTVDEFGKISVPESLAELLVNSNIGWRYLNSSKTEEPADEVTIDDFEKEIKAMSTIELVDLANKSGFPEEEWLKFSQNKKSSTMLMQVYIVKKLKEQEALKEASKTEEPADDSVKEPVDGEAKEKTENAE